MTRLVIDASVLAAITFGEPEAEAWSRRIEGAAVFAPRLLQYELQSVANKKCSRHPRKAAAILSALDRALDPTSGITWMDAQPSDVVLIASTSGLTAYDASYLCLAGMLGADLATADRRLAAALEP